MYYPVNPVVAGVLKVILSNFPCSGWGWGVPSYSPYRIPTKTQNILSGSPFNDHLEQQHFHHKVIVSGPHLKYTFSHNTFFPSSEQLLGLSFSPSGMLCNRVGPTLFRLEYFFLLSHSGKGSLQLFRPAYFLLFS